MRCNLYLGNCPRQNAITGQFLERTASGGKPRGCLLNSFQELVSPVQDRARPLNHGRTDRS
ncbi:MAG: hypothetical protein QNJ70_18085, partial [Xenococcaceae cyanobacterium MO_207.B15]|nr:hypothetical protein [Xenococcaceae cyanobacterium MO_207.B15]